MKLVQNLKNGKMVPKMEPKDAVQTVTTLLGEEHYNREVNGKEEGMVQWSTKEAKGTFRLNSSKV